VAVVNYLIYTDGSASVKDRTGGYAWKIVYEDGKEFVGGGSAVDTTISRMELMAAIDALEQIDAHEYLVDNDVVLIISDSEYVVKGFMDKNRARNKNVDLWLWLEEEASHFELVHLQHTKGHANDVDNNEVDKLAGEFRQAAVRSLNAEC
jgi:ribonuclease HI